MKMKTPTVRAARQGLKFGTASQAGSEFDPTILALELQRHSPVEWLAARANVSIPTARVHAELFGIGARQ